MKRYQLYSLVLIMFCFMVVSSAPLNTAQSAVAEALPDAELSPEDEANLIEHLDELESWDLIENMELLENLELLENIEIKPSSVKGS